MTVKLYTTEIGAGVQVVASTLSPNKQTGVITAKISANSSTNVTRNNLYSIAQSAMPLEFPGSAIPRDRVRAQLGKAGSAILTAYYSSGSSGSGGFREVLQISPVGVRPRRVYNLTSEYLANPANRDDAGKPKPIIIPQPIVAIRWSSVVYSDVRPTDFNYLAGQYNNNNYRIDGYFYGRGTLRFSGMWITHQKYAAYDRWIRQYAVAHDPSGWMDQNIRLVSGATSSQWQYADPSFVGEPGLLANFPTLN